MVIMREKQFYGATIFHGFKIDNFWRIVHFLLKTVKFFVFFTRFNVSEVDSSGYDIALIRLPRPVMTPNEDYNENVLPICIPWNDEVTQIAIKKIESDIDISNILSKLKEIDNMKKVIFDP